MTASDYIKKHGNRFPFGSEENVCKIIQTFEFCESEAEIKWYKNLIIEENGAEEWELFKEYCLETGSLTYLFSPKE